jgi:2-polyprenyl-6-methoxyphenol hydroxylase-like FAD-dependent oxidoreductase
MKPGRALVIGGSLGGLFAGLFLRKLGWDTEIFERASDALASRGAGIVTYPELWSVIAAAGLPGDIDKGVDVVGRITFDGAGQIVGSLAFPQTMTSWESLFTLLRDAWPDARYHQGRELVDVHQDQMGVTAVFADGSKARGDLLVAADGFRSAVRERLFHDAQPVYAGYVAWRALVPEADLPADAHAALFNHFAFCLPEDEQVIGYPVAGEGHDLRPGHRRYNLGWYRRARERDQLADLLTDSSGVTHAMSIPPPLIRPDIVAEMRARAEYSLAPPLAAVIRAARMPFFQPIYELDSARMTKGRVALLGDAAYVARPHVGAGVVKAGLDAQALAAALKSQPDVVAALDRYHALRAPAGRRMVARGRYLGAYMQGGWTTAEEWRLADLRHTAEAVMAETGLLNF